MGLRFPSTWRDHARRTGSGLRLLLREDHEADLEEARHTCEFGILASQPPTLDALRATGRRLLASAIEPFEVRAEG